MADLCMENMGYDSLLLCGGRSEIKWRSRQGSGDELLTLLLLYTPLPSLPPLLFSWADSKTRTRENKLGTVREKRGTDKRFSNPACKLLHLFQKNPSTHFTTVHHHDDLMHVKYAWVPW